MEGDGKEPARSVPAWLERVASWSWRLLVVAAAAAVFFWLLGELWPVFLPLVVAVFLARILARPNAALRRRGLPPGVAAGAVLVGLLVVGAAAATVMGSAVADETDQIGPTVSEAIDDLETWVVEDSPFDVDRAQIEELRAEVGDRVREVLESSSGSLVSGVVVVVEVLVSLILGLIITFFALKDGTLFIDAVRGWLPESRRALADRLARRAWLTLGGYFRGAALLGVVEGAVIGIALFVVGAQLAVPMAALTFLAAFVPFVGAIVAGALATLVALATAGTAEALIVLVVAIVVQQIDNDLLAPVVYGRALNLHPVAVLLAITGGGAMFGIAGSFLAVPVTAVVVNVVAEARRP